MSTVTTAAPPNHVMSGRTMQWVYRTLPTLASLVVAAASFALSFVALRDVSASVDAVPANMAWLVPIVIDGGVMGGSAVIWSQAATGAKREKFPFFVVGVLVALSVVVNAAHAGPTLLAKTIAALPPLVLLATLELVASATRSWQRQAAEVAANEAAIAAAEAATEAARQAADVASTELVLRGQVERLETERRALTAQLAAQATRRSDKTSEVSDDYDEFIDELSDDAPDGGSVETERPAVPEEILDRLDDIDLELAEITSKPSIGRRQPRVKAVQPEDI